MTFILIIFAIIVPLFLIKSAWHFASKYHRTVFIIYLSSAFVFLMPQEIILVFNKEIENAFSIHKRLISLYCFFTILTFFILSYKNDSKLLNFSLFYFILLSVFMIIASLMSSVVTIS